MKIIVIGATGTIGAAVASALEKEHEVIGASRKGDVQSAESNLNGALIGPTHSD